MKTVSQTQHIKEATCSKAKGKQAVKVNSIWKAPYHPQLVARPNENDHKLNSIWINWLSKEQLVAMANENSIWITSISSSGRTTTAGSYFQLSLSLLIQYTGAWCCYKNNCVWRNLFWCNSPRYEQLFWQWSIRNHLGRKNENKQNISLFYLNTWTPKQRPKSQNFQLADLNAQKLSRRSTYIIFATNASKSA